MAAHGNNNTSISRAHAQWMHGWLDGPERLSAFFFLSIPSGTLIFIDSL